MMADKMVPVVAAAAGTIGWVSSTCCALEIEHDDGWSSMYIHLNNDTPGTDDGLGWGIMPGLERGVHVDAGQLIGWVGDSGNAEWTGSHLHFELHTPDGVGDQFLRTPPRSPGGRRGAGCGRLRRCGLTLLTAPPCWAGSPISSTSGSPGRSAHGRLELRRHQDSGHVPALERVRVSHQRPISSAWPNRSSSTAFPATFPSPGTGMATAVTPSPSTGRARAGLCSQLARDRIRRLQLRLRRAGRSAIQPATSTATESTPSACTGCATVSSTTATPTPPGSPTTSSSSARPAIASWPATGTVMVTTRSPSIGGPTGTSCVNLENNTGASRVLAVGRHDESVVASTGS